MAAARSSPPTLIRTRTGIAGLDAITHGGLFQGGMYLVVGQPGTGKTILGNQLCFNHIAAGGNALYITVLAENHVRMFAHLQEQSFFDLALVGEQLKYFSVFSVLDQRGLDGLLELVRKEIRDHRATLVVMDGLTPIGEAAPSQIEFERFLQRLQTITQTLSCVTILSSQPHSELRHPTYTMVDGVIELHYTTMHSRAVRSLSMPKFRGSAFMEGRHSYTITSDGLTVYPQLEAAFPQPKLVSAGMLSSGSSLSFVDVGAPGLNAMLGGGLPAHSSTLVIGAPGTGKTLLGLHFLMAGALQGEPGLHFGFNEIPERLIGKGQRIGLDMRTAVANGMLEFQWQPPIDQVLDVLGAYILEQVARRGLRRLVIDSVSGLVSANVDPERFPRFLTALLNELRARGVTVLLSIEQPDVIGPQLRLPFDGHTQNIDNIILLRHVELQSQLYRLISIVNISESVYDTSIREFQISDKGIQVAETFASAEAILTGVARPLVRQRAKGAVRAPKTKRQ